MSNQVAGEGQVFICSACGKRSHDRYGEQPISSGWDESCMMHSVLVIESSVILDRFGLVAFAKPVASQAG
jgi:hypothetical protein